MSLTDPRLRQSLRSAQALFAELPAPATLAGVWRAEFVGPTWLGRLARIAMPLSVLRGWCGKRFDAQGRGENLVRRRGKISGIVPMRERHQASKLDGRPVAVAAYGAGTPLSLRYVEDELRELDAATLLGMMTFRIPGLRGLGLPFLLHRVADESVV